MIDYITIYYLTGESLAATGNSPNIEVLNKKRFEVVDSINGYAITQLKGLTARSS
jgi:HSP90 family molecular chaperone